MGKKKSHASKPRGRRYHQPPVCMACRFGKKDGHIHVTQRKDAAKG